MSEKVEVTVKKAEASFLEWQKEQVIAENRRDGERR